MGRQRCIALGVAAALMAACGGPITNDELQRGVETLGATAAEGHLVALDAVEDRTKTTFVRVHTRQLADDIQHEAEKLHDAQARPSNADLKAQAVRLAQAIDAELGDLQVAPADRRVARRVANRLDALTKRAQDLVDRL